MLIVCKDKDSNSSSNSNSSNNSNNSSSSNNYSGSNASTNTKGDSIILLHRYLYYGYDYDYSHDYNYVLDMSDVFNKEVEDKYNELKAQIASMCATCLPSTIVSQQYGKSMKEKSRIAKCQKKHIKEMEKFIEKYNRYIDTSKPYAIDEYNDFILGTKYDLLCSEFIEEKFFKARGITGEEGKDKSKDKGKGKDKDKSKDKDASKDKDRDKSKDKSKAILGLDTLEDISARVNARLSSLGIVREEEEEEEEEEPTSNSESNSNYTPFDDLYLGGEIKVAQSICHEYTDADTRPYCSLTLEQYLFGEINFDTYINVIKGLIATREMHNLLEYIRTKVNSKIAKIKELELELNPKPELESELGLGYRKPVELMAITK